VSTKPLPVSQAAATDAAASRTAAKDVARLAGVSTATVSRAMNNPELVDPETLERVRGAMKKLRYVPHGLARSLRSQRSKMVGAIVPSFDYALYARMTSSLQQRLSEHGYAMVLAEQHYDLQAEIDVARQLIQHSVDAFVFVGGEHDPRLFSLLEDYGRPYVLTWGVDPSGRHPSVGFDSRAATHALTRHLIGLGHRKFGFVSADPQGNDRARERGAGIRAALAEAGLSLRADWVQYARITLASAQEAMGRILAQDERPTAVLATNDVLAVGAMMACRAAGVRIPEDISITGVDNTDLGATQTPALTSVRTPIVEIGDAAARQLVARLQGKPFQAQQEFGFELVFRGSTAAPRV
jgi:LacI family transcriptional regulator